jgi:Pilus formation protein N terminal region
MTALCVAGRTAKSALHWFAAAALAAVFTVQIVPQAAAQQPLGDGAIIAPLDQATLFKLPERAGTVVIGNPLIADVSLQAGGVAVITPKGYGATNVVALDRDGAVLLQKAIVVTSPAGRVVYVYRGPRRMTYACDPDCSRRVNLGDDPGGDDPDEFDKILGQTVSRTTQAMTAGSNGAAPK